MKKVQKGPGQPDQHSLFLAAVIVVVTLVLFTVMNARISRLYQKGTTVRVDLDITPAYNPTGKRGWKTFSHPEHTFTFIYPQSWQVSLTKANIRDRGYNLLLLYTVGGRPHRVEFTRGGRGTGEFDSVNRDTREYGGHTGYKNIYVKDGTPIREVITFRDTSLIHPYIAIDAELPPTQTMELQATIDTIASSIKRTDK